MCAYLLVCSSLGKTEFDRSARQTLHVVPRLDACHLLGVEVIDGDNHVADGYLAGFLSRSTCPQAWKTCIVIFRKLCIAIAPTHEHLLHRQWTVSARRIQTALYGQAQTAIVLVYLDDATTTCGQINSSHCQRHRELLHTLAPPHTLCRFRNRCRHADKLMTATCVRQSEDCIVTNRTAIRVVGTVHRLVLIVD